MLRLSIVPIAAGLLALAALPALGLFPARDAEAQGAPPTIGMVLYGDAPAGAVSGQKITALVVGASGTTTCGSGEVLDSGGLKFVVRVRPSSALTGCGQPGTSVQLFFNAAGTTSGRLATQQVPWQIGPKLATVTLGDALPVRGRLPMAARDGVN